jgi:hypothetical protein
LPPKKLELWELPSSPLQEAVVKDWAWREMARRVRPHTKTNLGREIDMVVSFGRGRAVQMDTAGDGDLFPRGRRVSESKSRFPSGMTDKKKKAKTKAT